MRAVLTSPIDAFSVCVPAEFRSHVARAFVISDTPVVRDENRELPILTA